MTLKSVEAAGLEMGECCAEEMVLKSKGCSVLRENTAVLNAWLLLINERFHRKNDSSSEKYYF